ncbi:MAG: hypothetical protein ACYTKD_29130 [Planctomycetota bacterium]
MNPIEHPLLLLRGQPVEPLAVADALRHRQALAIRAALVRGATRPVPALAHAGASTCGVDGRATATRQLGEEVVTSAGSISASGTGVSEDLPLQPARSAQSLAVAVKVLELE